MEPNAELNSNEHWFNRNGMLNMRKTLLNYLLVSLISSGFWLSPALAQSNPKLTAGQLQALVRSTEAGANVTVVGSGPSVTILSEKAASASERSLKVDAMFLAKAMIDGAGGQVESVKILYSQTGSAGRFITINKKLVDDYGAGRLTPDQLLGSLNLVTVGQERSTAEIAEGPLMERRLLVWQRIEKLKEQGTGVSAFEKLFQQMEQSVKSSDEAALSPKVSFLETKLGEQEEQLKQAKRAQQGHGIRVPKGSGAGSSSTTASQPPSGLQPMPMGGGPGGSGHGGGGGAGQGQNRNQPWGMPSGGQGQGGFPGPEGFPGGGPPGGGPPGGGPPGGGPPGGGPPP